MDAVEFLQESVRKSEIEIVSQYTKFQSLASKFSGKVVFDEFSVNLFAARLLAEVRAGNAPAHLYDAFVRSFDANAGQFSE